MSRTIVRHSLVRLQYEGLVVTRRNRGAFVAEPALEEAKHIFERRRALEAEVIRILVDRMPMSGFDQLESHVRSEQSMRGKDGRVSIRLAGEFRTLLAKLTGNDVLTRYVSEVVLRCSLIMAMYAKTHSSDCAVDEHPQIRERDAGEAIGLMDHHLGAVADRAELEKEPDSISSTLSRYGKELVS